MFEWVLLILPQNIEGETCPEYFRYMYCNFRMKIILKKISSNCSFFISSYNSLTTSICWYSFYDIRQLWFWVPTYFPYHILLNFVLIVSAHSLLFGYSSHFISTPLIWAVLLTCDGCQNRQVAPIQLKKTTMLKVP